MKTISILLCVAFETEHNVLRPTVQIGNLFHFFYSNIIHCWMILHCVDKLQLVYHLPAHTSLNCFQFGAMIIKDAVNIHDKALFEYMLLFHLDKYVGVRILDYMVSISSTLQISAKLFSIMAITFCIVTSNFWVSRAALQQNLTLSVFLIKTILLSVHRILLWL